MNMANTLNPLKKMAKTKAARLNKILNRLNKREHGIAQYAGNKGESGK